MLTRLWWPLHRVELNPTNGIASTFLFQYIGQQQPSPGEGLLLRPGNYTLPMTLTYVRHFTSFGVKIQGGVDNANIQIGAVSFNGNGILVDATTSVSTQVNNVNVSFCVAQVGVPGPKPCMHELPARLSTRGHGALDDSPSSEALCLQ